MLYEASAFFRALAICVISLWLTACGGNGGGSLQALGADAPTSESGQTGSTEFAEGSQAEEIVQATNQTAFLPANNLVLQLEADSGIIESFGFVTDWLDQSSSANSVSAFGAPELIENKLNGYPVIEFDGVGSRLQRTSDVSLPSGNSDRTVMMLADYGNSGAGGFAYGARICNEAFQVGISAQGTATVDSGCDQPVAQSNTQLRADGWIVQSAMLQNSVLTQRVNDKEIHRQPASLNTAVEELVIGGQLDKLNFSRMRVAAVLVWDRALSDSEFNSTLAYLQNKYAVQTLEVEEELQESGTQTPDADSAPPNTQTPTPESGSTPEPEDPAELVADAPEIASPNVSLTSSNIIGGGVELRWAGENADSCIAGGDWSGERDPQGNSTISSARVGDTFRITCSNQAGSSIAIVTITTRDVLLSWTPPQEVEQDANTSILDSYRIVYGASTGNYTEAEETTGTDPSLVLSLEPGDYYLAISAIDASGAQSDLSNEIAFRLGR